MALGTAVAVSVGRTRQVSAGAGRVGETVADWAGVVVTGAGTAVTDVEGLGVGEPGLFVGWGLSTDAGTEPGRIGEAVTLLEAMTATADLAERTRGGRETGRAEAGRTVTPWRYASAMAVTVRTYESEAL